MHRSNIHLLRSIGAAMLAVVLTTFALAGPAGAHDPIFVSDDQTSPDSGPYMPDGTISWALYGQVLAADETRGFEFDLRDGDELYVSLLIPNLSPELELSDAELPVLELTAPDGTTRTLTADIRDIFDEPFSKTSYVTLLEVREPGQAGRYSGLVIGAAPSRFTVAIGETEIFFTETERSGDRPDSFADITGPLQVWYSTPPGGEPQAISDDVGIDEAMIEEVMESGEAVDSREVRDDADVEPATEAIVDTVTDADADADESVEVESVEEVPAEETPAEELVEDTPDEDSGDATAQGAENEDSELAADDGQSAGSSTGWVAPVVIGAVIVGALAVFAVRRNSDAR